LYNETGRSGNVIYEIKQTHDNVVRVRVENSITGVDAQQYYTLIENEKTYEARTNINEILNRLIEKLED